MYFRGCGMFISSTKEVMFLVRFVCLIFKQDCAKNYQLKFHKTWWQGVAWVRGEHIKFWSGSDSQGGSTNYFFAVAKYARYGVWP